MMAIKTNCVVIACFVCRGWNKYTTTYPF